MKHLKFFPIFLTFGLCSLNIYSQDGGQGVLSKGNDILDSSFESGWINFYIQLPPDQRILKMMAIVDSLEKEIVTKESNENIESQLQKYRDKIDWRKKNKIMMPNDYAKKHYCSFHHANS